MTSGNFVPGTGRVDVLDEKHEVRNFKTAFVPDNKPQKLDPLDNEVWDRIPNPAGWRILVRPYLGSKVSKGGILLPAEGSEREALATVVGYVLKMGPICYRNPRKFDPNPETGVIDPWCKEGDWILIGKYAGSRFRLYFDTGENPEVRMINDDEVIGKILDPDDVRTL